MVSIRNASDSASDYDHSFPQTERDNLRPL
jgi:hypothetical protein